MRWVKVDENGCWIWQGRAINKDGYARLIADGRRIAVHRAAYELFIGPIPAGREIDHLCKIRLCVKAIADEYGPPHLEAVTPQLNVHRCDSPAGQNARRDQCMHGHPFDLLNTYVTPDGRRQCRVCMLRRSRSRAA